MVEIGNVVDIDEKKRTARVRFERKSACEGCGMCMFKKHENTVDMLMDNSLDAKVGEQVEVEMSSGIVLLSAVIAYALPVLFAGLGLLVGLLLKNEILQFVLCLVFLIVGYIIIILLDRRFKYTKRVQPKMTAFYKEEKEEK